MKSSRCLKIWSFVLIVGGSVLILAPLFVDYWISNTFPYRDVLIGAGIALFILGLSLRLPNEVLDLLKRSVLPLFVRKDTRFPHPRFFEIIKHEAIALHRVDIFAHFHAHWLGITEEKDDTTNHHGTFYRELFHALKEVHYKNQHSKTKPILRILFLNYNDFSEDPKGLKKRVGDLLGIEPTNGIPVEEIITTWGTEASAKFGALSSNELQGLIDCKILDGKSKIKQADFVPSMGIIRLVYTDKIGANSWVQAEFLSHAKEDRKKVGSNRFTIMFQARDITGKQDSRIDLFDSILDGEWGKARPLNKSAVES